MSKQAFLDRLRAALNGRIPVLQIEDTIRYYQDYIGTQINSGKSEEEVMEALGDPRLIARTIIETACSGDGKEASGNHQNSFYQDGSYQENYNYNQRTQGKTRHRTFRMQGWLAGILTCLVIFAIVSIVFSVLSFLAPVIVVAASVIFLIKLFRDWLN